MAREQEGSLARACSDVAAAMSGPETGRETNTDTGTGVIVTIAERAADVLRVASAAIVLGPPGAPPTVVVAGEGPVADLYGAERELGEGPSYDARAGGAPVRVPTLVDAGRRWSRWADQARLRDVGAWLAVPSRTGPGAALLLAASPRARRWASGDLTAARVLVDLAAGCAGWAAELDRAHREVGQLHEALAHRVVIEQAKGILAGELGCTLEEAFGLLRDQARRRSVTVRSVADAVVHLGLRPQAPAAGVAERPAG